MLQRDGIEIRELKIPLLDEEDGGGRGKSHKGLAWDVEASNRRRRFRHRKICPQTRRSGPGNHSPRHKPGDDATAEEEDENGGITTPRDRRRGEHTAEGWLHQLDSMHTNLRPPPKPREGSGRVLTGSQTKRPMHYHNPQQPHSQRISEIDGDTER